jgi:hypothetical protein
MAKQAMTFDTLVEKVIKDPPFRQQLIKDPQSALKAQGVDATDEMVAALNKVDYASITRVADQFGRDKGLHPDSPFT